MFLCPIEARWPMCDIERSKRPVMQDETAVSAHMSESSREAATNSRFIFLLHEVSSFVKAQTIFLSCSED